MRRVGASVDVAAVLLFVLIGRASHHHGETPLGVLSTVWPFAAGIAVGWVVVARRPPTSLLTGAMVCAATVGVGMALRVAAGQGTAPAFIAVSLGFLGAGMVGGRAVLGVARRRSSSPATRR